MDVLQHISLDVSLARGLDYYTGIICEATLVDMDQVGSIAAGGRYDDLIGLLASKQVPAVGVSIGVDRILSILEEREIARGALRKNEKQVLLASIPSRQYNGEELLSVRMQLASLLWKSGIRAEFLYDRNPKPEKQLDYALEHQIPLIVWIGENELKNNAASVKNMRKKQQTEVKREELVAFLQKEILQFEHERSTQEEKTQSSS